MELLDKFVGYSARPVPLRTVLLRRFLRHFPVGSYKARLHAGGVHRPAYGWCLYYAALEAQALGYRKLTVVELGVAGGNGLVCLCEHKQNIRKELGIEIEIVGFDSGTGLPPSTDARDVKYFWPPNAFALDRVELEKRLECRARLVLGDVADTISQWEPEPDAPLGAVMFDLDYYTSTMHALDLLKKNNVLPRIWCYFDDVCASPEAALTDRIGEREAIREFNDMPERKILRDHLSLAYPFKGVLPEPWHQQMYLYHRMSHPKYNENTYQRTKLESLSLH